MSSQPPDLTPPDLVKFDASLVHSVVDCTIFLNNEPCAGFTSKEQAEQYDKVAEYLLWPDWHPQPAEFRAWPQFSKHLEPRLAVAADVRFGWRGEDRNARALMCFAARQQSISITLRSITPDTDSDGKKGAPDPICEPDGGRLIESNFTASEKYDDGEKHFWFSVHDQTNALWKHIHPDSSRGRPHGLVILTGSTDSSKSLIARGLVQKALEHAKEANKVRRPHLVTFEDPIEKFYAEPKKPKKSETKGGQQDEDDKYLNIKSLSYTSLAYCLGVDYTPREKGKDVHDLRQGFADALRQTPAVYYIGEVRDPQDWPQVLEFAGTNHLVITTAHAGSLQEAMTKLMASVGAATPATRRQWAGKLLAVVHLRTIGEFADADNVSRHLLLPSVWRRTQAGLASLSVNGIGAVVPSYPDAKEAPVSESSLGRRYFLEWMSRNKSMKSTTPPNLVVDVPAPLQQAATSHDLRGE